MITLYQISSFSFHPLQKPELQYPVFYSLTHPVHAARNCIEEFGKKSQKVMFFNLEKARNMINNMLVELYNQGLIEASVAT